MVFRTQHRDLLHTENDTKILEEVVEARARRLTQSYAKTGGTKKWIAIEENLYGYIARSAEARQEQKYMRIPYL